MQNASAIYRVDAQSLYTVILRCSIRGPWGIRHSDENEHFGTHWEIWFLVVLEHYFSKPARCVSTIRIAHCSAVPVRLVKKEPSELK